MLQLLTALLNLFRRPKGPAAPPSISPDYPPKTIAPAPSPTAPAAPKTPVSLPATYRPDEWAGITVESLVAIGVSRANAEKHSPALNRACARFNIKSHARICAFLAQVCHESGHLAIMRENLNYSAERLCVVFPKKFPSVEAARPYVGNRDKLAEKLYGGRVGNDQPGDGAKFTGRGFIQLTFKANYERCGRALGLDLVSAPALVEGSEVAALAAAWFFSAHGCNEISDANSEDAVKRATKVINGGYNGLDDRLAIWRKAKRAFAHLK